MSTYEELRDSTGGAAGHDWQEADRKVAKLRQTYASLQDASEFTDEHKASQAWAAYQQTSAEVRELRRQARERLEESARSRAERSIPLPKGAERRVEDASELVAAQNEAGRIRQQIDRRSSAVFGAKPADVLSEEYDRAMQTGGVEGAAIARGVLAVARERGVDVNALVDAHRQEHHREAQQQSELAAHQARHVGGPAVPAPPFDPPPGVSVPPGVKPRRKPRGKGRPAWLR